MVKRKSVSLLFCHTSYIPAHLHLLDSIVTTKESLRSLCVMCTCSPEHTIALFS